MRTTKSIALLLLHERAGLCCFFLSELGVAFPRKCAFRAGSVQRSIGVRVPTTLTRSAVRLARRATIRHAHSRCGVGRSRCGQPHPVRYQIIRRRELCGAGALARARPSRSSSSSSGRSQEPAPSGVLSPTKWVYIYTLSGLIWQWSLQDAAAGQFLPSPLCPGHVFVRQTASGARSRCCLSLCRRCGARPMGALCTPKWKSDVTAGRLRTPRRHIPGTLVRQTGSEPALATACLCAGGVCGRPWTSHTPPFVGRLRMTGGFTQQLPRIASLD